MPAQSNSNVASPRDAFCTQGTSPPLDAFAQALAAAPGPEAREQMIARAKAMAAQRVAPDALDVPELLTAEALAGERNGHLTAARAIIGELGYAEHAARLAADDANATAARNAVAAEITARFGLDASAAERVVIDAATGRTGEAFRVLDPAGIENPEPPAWLTPGRWYEGRLHLLFGREGTNKTILVLHDLLTLAAAGRHSILVEYEMGEEAIAVLIAELGFDRRKVRPYLHVVDPQESFDAGMLDALMARWRQAEAVALDNLSEAVVSARGDEDKSGDALTALQPMRDLAHRGVTTIAIDHLPHHREDAARGSTAKGQITEVAFSIQARPPVTRTTPGKLKLVCRKDRRA